jgi:uncharacterized membrane protein
MQNPTPGQVLFVLTFVVLCWFGYLVDSGKWNDSIWYAILIGSVVGVVTGICGSSCRR